MKTSIFHTVLWASLGSELLGGLMGCASIQPPHKAASIPEATVHIPSGEPLKLEWAVAVALQQDPETRAARRQVSAAYWDKAQSSLPANPSATISADPTEWALKLAAQISDVADLGGRRRKQVDMAQSREEQAALEVVRREIELTRQTRSAYAEVIARRHFERLLAEKQGLLARIADLAKRRQELGDLARLEAMEFERELAKAGMALADEATARDQAEARLNRLLGRPLQAPLKLPEDTEFPGPWDTWSHSNPTPMDLGILRRPELAGIALRIQERRAALALARLSWIPGVEGGPQFIRNTSERSLELGGEITLTLPIFDRGQARTAREKATLEALEEELAATQADLLLEVHEAALAARRAQARATRDAPALAALAEEEFEHIQKMKGLGEAGEMDVLPARARLLDAKSAVHEARLAWRQAQADLAAALGESPASE